MKKNQTPGPEGPDPLEALEKDGEDFRAILKAFEEEGDEIRAAAFLKAIDGEDCQAGRTIETRKGK